MLFMEGIANIIGKAKNIMWATWGFRNAEGGGSNLIFTNLK
jgi:hypothetical protein